MTQGGGSGSSDEVSVERRRSEGSPEKTGKVSLGPEGELERGKLFRDGLQVLSWQEQRGRGRTENSEGSCGGQPAASSGGKGSSRDADSGGR